MRLWCVTQNRLCTARSSKSFPSVKLAQTQSWSQLGCLLQDLAFWIPEIPHLRTVLRHLMVRTHNCNSGGSGGQGIGSFLLQDAPQSLTLYGEIAAPEDENFGLESSASSTRFCWRLPTNYSLFKQYLSLLSRKTFHKAQILCYWNKQIYLLSTKMCDSF